MRTGRLFFLSGSRESGAGSGQCHANVSSSLSSRPALARAAFIWPQSRPLARPRLLLLHFSHQKVADPVALLLLLWSISLFQDRLSSSLSSVLVLALASLEIPLLLLLLSRPRRTQATRRHTK